MNRQPFNDWSIGLTDDEFACALAAAGAIEHLWQRAEQLLPDIASGNSTAAQALAMMLRRNEVESGGRLHWQMPQQTLSPAAPPAARFAALWPKVLMAAPAAIHLRLLGEPTALLAACSRTLSRAAVAARAVSLQAFEAAQGRVDWQLPFTFATVPGDPLGSLLDSRQADLPPGWPYRFAPLDRRVERPEILVFGCGVAEALSGLLSLAVRPKCCLVLVAGLGREDLASALPLLRTMAVRLRADGIAVLPVDSGLDFLAQQLRWLGDELSHNRPLDAAMTMVFGREVLLMASDDLLKLSRLDHAISDLSGRLRQLPADAGITLTRRTLEQLRLMELMREQQQQSQATARPPSAWRDRLRHIEGFPQDGIKTSARPPSEAAPLSPAPVNDLVASAGAVSKAIDSARGSFEFHGESAEAASLTEVAAEVRAHEALPGILTPRYIQQQSFTAASGAGHPERRGYARGEAVTVHVRVAPADDAAGWTLAPEAFPDQQLPKDRTVHHLRVMFHEPRQLDAPLLATLQLPATGASDEARFSFTLREAGPFEARITLLHLNRVLQTALLRTTVAARREQLAPGSNGLRLDIEVEVRRNFAELGQRQRFDLAMVLNHTPLGQRRLTALAGRRAWASDLSGIDAVVDRINTLISGVANNTKDHDKGLDKGRNPALLARLARIGRNLYTVLDPRGDGALVSDGLDLQDDSITHIQVISTRMDEVVPIEFIYDYPLPAENAKLCPQHREALTKGACPGACPGRTKPAAHVCPMGFWGVRKVIERHAYNPRLPNPDGADLVLQAEPVGDRDRLDWRRGSVLGHSERVERTSVDALAALLTTGASPKPPVAIAGNWKEWKKLVKKHRPGLLIAFPHNSGENEDVQLEIGKAQLITLDLDSAYVRDATGGAPVVLLLGCDTAGTAESFSSHVRFFRKAGAAVVVSTIATVFGAHAVKVGDQIVRALLAPRSEGNDQLGEVLREAKRQALLASVPMALCVVAFGDADWKL